MPKLVDHRQRREELVEALWRVIVKHGIEHASVRSVSAETGWSRGVVAYYFSTMDELLLAGLQRACEIDVRARRAPATQDGPAALRAVLLTCMPLDDERRLRSRVWLSYLGRAAGDTDIAAELALCQRSRAKVYEELVADMIARGELAADRDPATEAAHIMAFELSMNVLEMLNPEHMTPELLSGRVDRFVDRLVHS